MIPAPPADRRLSSPGRTRARRWPLLLGALLAAATAGSALGAPARPPDAFPGAEGFGRAAQGGRGGRIVPVTNLADSGPGSLRACVLETGPRSCVFRVSGIIVLKRALLIDGSAAGRLSILGQSAPGAGVTLTVSPDSTSFMRTILIVRNAADVVIRHLRLRSQSDKSVLNVDAITVQESRRVYVDHVSGAWASDENFDADAQTSDLTVAYSIFGEGLRVHSKCALMGSGAKEPQRISFWRNLCISNNDRNPDNNHFAQSCIEITDNLFYNARSEWAEIFSQWAGGTPISFVGNTFKAGPSTFENTVAIHWKDTKSAAPPRIYASDNAVWAPEPKRVVLIAPDTARFLAAEPPCPLSAPTLGEPGLSYREVVSRAGAFPRDGLDRRFVREVGEPGVAGKGKLRTQPGTLDPVAPAEPYSDADGDGMADELEARFGARPGTFDPWEAVDEEGWSSFDRFMQWLSQERVAGRVPD